ncbi:AfsR/SARP family transcriptional regulator [Jidongwangia harbinensis]|uniref:AfsR/SARP family transcriptional regulator n=1 Tax=Jidongwangia harbinensis TaxID=2878561 RepID=UPI001CD9391D|nr:BTAD domain-containing putative transcriptional regulator [Jidongwangia harbinensis]MCA2211620.1 transcriptional regulator [Jidongwangia harbinensis]
MSTDLRFRILGPVEVWHGDRPVPLGAAKQRALLACLLLRGDGAVVLPELYAALWGERLPSSPRAAVHNYVRRLRQSIGSATIVTTPGGYRLVTDPGSVDLHRFRRLVSEARRDAQAGDLHSESNRLREALALWRGRPLADVSSDLLQRYEAPALLEERIAALERRIAVDLDLGGHAELVGELRALLGEYPLRENFWAQLILALHRLGRSAEALAAYHQARTVLAEETGLDPGAELQALYRGILRGDSVLAGHPPGRPPAARPPSQLPPEVTGFVGRGDRVDVLVRFLAPEAVPAAVPVVAVCGPPGVGKTALAIHVGHRLRRRFPDGQLYADLHGYAAETPVRPADLLPRFLRGLGAPAGSVPEDVEEQTALYRSLLADRAVLVVLDNALSPDQVRPLLPAEPRCAVLLTSRDNLPGLVALHGARRVRVDALSAAASLDLLAALVGRDRVARELDVATELAGLCGHLPIALRAVGANLANRPDLSIAGYVAEVRTGNRFGALSVHGDERAAVGATFGYSYRALSPPARRAFRHLGLLPADEFTADEAGTLFGTSGVDTTALLGVLTNANLIEYETSGRYRIHGLLRCYAGQLAAVSEHPEEQAAARGRLTHRVSDRAPPG